MRDASLCDISGVYPTTVSVRSYELLDLQAGQKLLSFLRLPVDVLVSF